MTDVARTAQYNGMVDMPVRTYTTAYSPINGTWQWNPNSLIPMEFHGFTSGLSPVGMWARLIDLNTGYTNIKYGNVTLALDNTANFRQPTWQNNKLIGWYTNVAPNNSYAYPYAYSAVLGMSVTNTRAFCVSQPAFVNSAKPNTGFPYSYGPFNMPGPGGTVVMSSIVSLQPFYYLSNGCTILMANPPVNLNLGGFTDFIDVSIGDFGGTSWITAYVPAYPTNKRRLINTDYANYAQPYLVSYAPADGVDIDSLVNATQIYWIATYSGFMTCFKNVLTIAGKTTTWGFGILASPDFNSYRIIRFLPQDATASASLTGAGVIQCKLDLSGALWLKNFNTATTLLISAGSVLKQLPIYFPVPVPDSTDNDPAVRLMRSAPNA
jgi:hypothetical protein